MRHLWNGARLRQFALLILLMSLFFPPLRYAYAGSTTIPAGAQAFSWGMNDFGQLGNGTTTRSNVPVQVSTSGVLSGKTVTQVAAGDGHSLALCSDGTLVAWGRNNGGQLGNGTTTDSSVPVQVNTSGVLNGRIITQIAAGGAHSLALCNDGTLLTWGANESGQLGTGGTTDSSVPVRLLKYTLRDKTVTQVSAGLGHSLAVCSDGTVLAWGYNGTGQLGDGSTTNRNFPYPVITTTALYSKSVTQVSAGSVYSLALCSDGTLVAWGYNGSGQLGNGSTTDSRAPVQVSTRGALSGRAVTQIVAAGYHSLALCSDGTLVAWGTNSSGELGNGTYTDSSVPVQVSKSGVLSGKTVTQVAVGAYHSLALCSDGTLTAWGRNDGGELGNGSGSEYPSAVPVLVSTTGVLKSGVKLMQSGGIFHSVIVGLPNGTPTPTPTPTPASNWKAQDISTSAGNTTSLLWLKSDNSFQVWNVSDAGANTQDSPVFAPITGSSGNWTPKRVGIAGDGLTRLLLARTDGAATIWTLNSSLGFGSSTATYGPYAGWSPVDMAVARDGSLRVLWTTSAGQASIWNINTAGTVSISPTYGPFSDAGGTWSTRKMAVGGDGLVRLLWNRSDGQVSLWLLDSALNQAAVSPSYGPYGQGYYALGLALDTSASSDNKNRVLLTRTDAAGTFWRLSSDNTTLEINTGFGPYPGWTPQALSVGGDGQMRALWTNTDGHAAFWKLSPDGTTFVVNTTFGPLP